ncbi:MAG: DUF4340 domain-containing protein [Planctomycetota bacterium]|jgi:hypothetical protein|nr:DUF4340 domain-containing protein [Planctomycetota bacterium]
MKPLHLAILVLILLALVGTGLYLRRPPPPAGGLSRQLALVSLVDPPILASEVEKIILSAPPEAEGENPPRREMLIVRDSAGDWWLESYARALTNRDKVESFLSRLASLSGDLQAESAESHRRLGVDTESAFKIELVKNGETAIIWVGVRPGGQWGESFVRRNAENQVYRVAADLRQEAGVTGYAASQASSAAWLDLNLAAVEVASATRLDLEYPEESFFFQSIPGGEGTWQLQEASSGGIINQERLRQLLTALAAVRASDLAPASEPAAESGEDAREYRLTLQDGASFKSEPLVLSVRKNGEEHRLSVSSRPGLTYLASPSDFTSWFPPPEELFLKVEGPVEPEALDNSSGE